MRAVLIAAWLLAWSLPAAARPAEARIEAAAAAYMARENVPGLAVVALRGDEVILAKGFGLADQAGRPMTPDTVQPIYSISKHLTAALALRLAEEGRLHPAEPAARRLPEWFADEPRLTLAHLMRQTSGLPEFVSLPAVGALEASQDGGGLAEAVALFDPLPRRFAPGARYGYSNSNFTALALALERAAGEPLGQAQRRRLFAPIGLSMDECARLRRAGAARAVGHTPSGEPWDLPPNAGATYAGNGGACASALDLARWMRALGAERVLDAPSLAQMTAAEPVGAGYVPPYGLGLSLVPLEGRDAWWHTGAGEGWGAFAAYLPQEELTLVVLANRGWLFITDFALPALRALLDVAEPPAPSPGPVPAAERQALVGRFEDGLFDYDAGFQGERLVLKVSAFPEDVVLLRGPDGVFVSPDRPDSFRLWLEPRADGALRPVFQWLAHRVYLEPAP